MQNEEGIKMQLGRYQDFKELLISQVLGSPQANPGCAVYSGTQK